MQTSFVTTTTTQPPPVHIYRMNDCDCIAATSLLAAMRCYAEHVGGEDDEFFDVAALGQLDEHALDHWHVRDDDGTRRSFRAELQRRLAAGNEPPFFFASTEQ